MLAACSLAIQGETWSQAGCALCHAIKGKGGKAGPDLSDVGAKRDAEWLEQFMRSPKVVMPQANVHVPLRTAEWNACAYEESGKLTAVLQRREQ
ncbi:MAG TPA: c-type cytochrome [Nitrospira sp.]|nr:c-type cytochrome [Nitrospira sp.]